MKPQLATGFEWIERAGVPALVCLPLAEHARHLFTTRTWALGSAPDGDDAAAWSAVASSLDVPEDRLVRMRQVHGASVLVKRAGEPAAKARAEADIAISDDPDIAIAIQTADCVPLLFADRATGAVAAAHAGWRGLAARVPLRTVEAMKTAFGTRPLNLIVAAGPSIGAARYEVGGEVRGRFETEFGAARIAPWFPRQTRPGHFAFDGWASARDQLLEAGVEATAIFMANLCTAAEPALFCSYRRDGKGAGRMAAAIRASGAGPSGTQTRR